MSTLAMLEDAVARVDATDRVTGYPLHHIVALTRIRTQPIEAGRLTVSRPRCQRSVGVRRRAAGVASAGAAMRAGPAVRMQDLRLRARERSPALVLTRFG